MSSCTSLSSKTFQLFPWLTTFLVNSVSRPNVAFWSQEILQFTLREPPRGMMAFEGCIDVLAPPGPVIKRAGGQA